MQLEGKSARQMLCSHFRFPGGGRRLSKISVMLIDQAAYRGFPDNQGFMGVNGVSCDVVELRVVWVEIYSSVPQLNMSEKPKRIALLDLSNFMALLQAIVQ